MSSRVEDETKFIHIGATIAQLAQIFRMSQKEVKNKVVGRVPPARVLGAGPGDATRYHLVDAAPFLCEPQVDIEEILKSMTPAKIPPMLQDAFWKAQKSRLDVEQTLGNLWSTERVVTILAEAFKPCRMAILMFKEDLEQRTELTSRQREILDQMSDGLLHSLHSGLVDKFKDYKPAEDEHGAPLGHATTIGVDTPPAEEEPPFDDGFGDD